VIALAVVAALGTGLMAGTFFAFSTFVMQSLAKLPAPQGIAAMQSINTTILMSLFMVVLVGSGALCVVAGVLAVVRWGRPGSLWILAGSLLYLVGNLIVTGAYNVPRNDALDAMDPNAAASAAEWVRWVASWQLGNHVRTLTGLASSAALIVGALAAKG
jgi:uncharacterized membrane protein